MGLVKVTKGSCFWLEISFAEKNCFLLCSLLRLNHLNYVQIKLEINMFKLLIQGFENHYQCRFCLEEQKTLRRLISPCSCTGTQKYVHISCLQKYLSLGKLSCPVCTKPFHLFVNDRKLLRIMANFCSWCYQAIYKQNIIISNRLLFDIHRGETMFSWKFVFSRFCEFALFQCFLCIMYYIMNLSWIISCNEMNFVQCRISLNQLLRQKTV